MVYTTIRRLVYLSLTASPLAGAQDLKLPDTPEILNVAPAPSDRFPAKWYPRVGDGTDVLPAPVVDKPYTAVVETVTPIQTPSGDSKPMVQHGFQARDRFGRTRSESPNGAMTVGGEMMPTDNVEVYDPVSHCQFHWMQLATKADMPPEARLAFVTCGPLTLRYKKLGLFETLMDTLADGTVTHGDVTTRTEHLAPLLADGITVNRLCVSNTRRDEQGQIKKWSSETWYSPDIEDIVRLGDEANGYTSLKEIRRVDSDSKLFYPPDGFTIEVQPDR